MVQGVKIDPILMCVGLMFFSLISKAEDFDASCTNSVEGKILRILANDPELCNGGAAIREIGKMDCIIAVGSASVINSGANRVASEIRSEKIAHAKAMAQLSSFLKTDVAVNRSFVVSENNEQSREKSVATVVEHSRMQLNNAKIVCKWFSVDKSVMYEAIYFELIKKENSDERVKK
jgi:hypothetical protein